MVPEPKSALLTMSSELVGNDMWCVRVTGEIDLSNSTRVAATLMAPAKTVSGGVCGMPYEAVLVPQVRARARIRPAEGTPQAHPTARLEKAIDAAIA
jgi:hypothetical protein